MATKKKVLLFSSFDTNGDGYTNIMGPLGVQLTKEFDVFAFGISYDLKQHPYNYGITPCRFNHIPSVIKSIASYTNVDAVIIGFDITLHKSLLESIEKPQNAKYVGIFAVESNPLIPSAAMTLMRMDKRFAISHFAAEECKKAGIIDTQHLPVALDPVIWTPRSEEEYMTMRESIGQSDKFVIFMNADANERKNIGVMYEALAELKKTYPNIHLNLLTRKNSPTGWNLDDLAFEFDLVSNVSVYDRGMPQRMVRQLICGADLAINPSKAESLGMMVLECQAVGVPVMGTNCTGMIENLQDGKGIPLDYSFVHIDPFLNGRRYLVSKDTIVKEVSRFIENKKADMNYYAPMVNAAMDAINQRTLENMGKLVIEAINE